MKIKFYFALFLITLSTLMFEILLTRIFSVTMWYHYAFVAISVAMFGMTVGALAVYLFPKFFSNEKTEYHIAFSSLLFSITIIFSFLTYLSIPFISTNLSLLGIYSIALNYSVISLPFVFSGIVVCLALTRYPGHISKLYAADLIGAGAGCVVLVLVLDMTDGPTTVFIIALLSSLSAVLFSFGSRLRKLGFFSSILSLLIAGFIALNFFLIEQNKPLIRLMWVKGTIEKTPLYEKWNSFSRIKVEGDSNYLDSPFGWGLSETLPPEIRIRQVKLDIDANASTYLTKFSGDFNTVKFLKYDITNLVHYIRENSRILVVGSGGGRDVLSSLLFRQKQVLAVELNKNIVNTANKKFGGFTGNIDRYPEVKFVNDEARSFIARSDDKFDIIQLSLIDTWAATAAGAFVLSENSLYTVQAFKTFISHLTGNGILSISRWYFRDKSTEMYRLVSIACKSMKELGTPHPERHLIIVRNMQKTQNPDEIPDGVGTMLFCRQPFSQNEIDSIIKIAAGFKFEVVFSAGQSTDPVYNKIFNDYDRTIAGFPLNISAPTDDSPFFFHSLKMSRVFSEGNWKRNEMTINMKAMYVLGTLMLVVSVLTIIFIILPLFVKKGQKNVLNGNYGLLGYFALIGLGFMFIEISQMQRLIIFLGHPVYSLSVVLFSLLLSSGVGSYLTNFLPKKRKSYAAVSTGLLIVLILFGILTPYLIEINHSSSNFIRILVAVILLMPIGLLMGTAFPTGMKLAGIRAAGLTPWLWGINGATSICASVLAVVIALSSGISATFWLGFACYFLAAVIMFFFTADNHQ